MKTLGDILVNGYERFLKVSPKDEPPETKEKKLLAPGEFSSRLLPNIPEPLTYKKIRDVAKQTPFFRKGVRKKGMDSTRAWFTFEAFKGSRPLTAKEQQLIDRFEDRSQIRQLMFKLFDGSRTFGDGYLLITFTNDDGIKINQPPKSNAEPWKLYEVKPEYITELGYPTEEAKRKFQLYFHYLDTEKGDEYWIHPDRMIHLPCDPLAGEFRGNSKINLLRNILLSTINVDIAAGETLAWFAHGFMDLVLNEAANDDEVDEVEKVASKHPGHWVHGDELTIDIKNPEAINPKPFYEYLIMKIAAALIMPTHVLTGVQTGRVTGSEVGFSDYYRDIHDIQEMEYNPIIRKLYGKLFSANGREWRFRINWNTIYVDESGESAIIKTRSEAVKNLREVSVINTDEAREYMNNGFTQLDPQRKIENDASSSDKGTGQDNPPDGEDGQRRAVQPGDEGHDARGKKDSKRPTVPS